MSFYKTTSLFLHFFGKRPWLPANLAGEEGLDPPRRERNRLKKAPPPDIFYSCQEFWGTLRSQTALALCADHSNANVLLPDQLLVESQPPPAAPAPIKSQRSSEAISELKPRELKRTRAKTPVYQIGQLEDMALQDSNGLSEDVDATLVVARQYQAELPSRSSTACSQNTDPSARHNGLRRVKCQDRLRDLVKIRPDQAESSIPRSLDTFFDDDAPLATLGEGGASRESLTESDSTPLKSPGAHLRRWSFASQDTTYFIRGDSSDSETLLGSDTEPSQNSPTTQFFSKPGLEAVQVMPENQVSSVDEEIAFQEMPKNDVGVQLCLELLTNDLATALHQQHPLELVNRVSGLQILLMIEAYESLQQNLRREREAHVADQAGEHVEVLDDVLNHWLQALRSIYERSASRDQPIKVEPVAS